MLLTPTEPVEIANIIRSLKHTVPGSDRNNADIVIARCDHISAPLSTIINQLFSEGFFPEDMKIAMVTPLHKGGAKINLINHRPVSVLNSISKIFEKAFLNRIWNFLDSSNAIHPNQFGFRPRYSMDLALRKFITHIITAWERKESGDTCMRRTQSKLVHMDLSEAFDHIDH